MGRSAGRFLVASALLLLLPGAALAAGEGGGNTIGIKLYDLLSDVWKPFFILVSFASFIGGLLLLGLGLTKLTRQHESRGGIWGSGLAHIVAAALLISLPDAAGVGITTVFGSSTTSSSLGATVLDTEGGDGSGFDLARTLFSIRAPGGTADCLGATAPTECMARNLAENAVPMGIWTLFAFAFIIGLIMFASAVADLAKGQDRGISPKGIAAKFISAIALMNGGVFFTYATNTLLGDRSGGATLDASGLVEGSSMLSYTPPAGPAILEHYANLIGHVFTILVFFGAWAFVKGIFTLRAASEQRGQATVGGGLVFLAGGILLANAKYTACVVMTTMGGTGMGATFCN